MELIALMRFVGRERHASFFLVFGLAVLFAAVPPVQAEDAPQGGPTWLTYEKCTGHL